MNSPPWRIYQCLIPFRHPLTRGMEAPLTTMTSVYLLLIISSQASVIQLTLPCLQHGPQKASIRSHSSLWKLCLVVIPGSMDRTPMATPIPWTSRLYLQCLIWRPSGWTMRWLTYGVIFPRHWSWMTGTRTFPTSTTPRPGRLDQITTRFIYYIGIATNIQ
ncbi:hypothetical protein DFS33DRAFT_120933 [Desarmillaria ectypa]|nr:hypothetical protein DFS33DRAFT_120933 [Desarmillaria ectypa]